MALTPREPSEGPACRCLQNPEPHPTLHFWKGSSCTRTTGSLSPDSQLSAPLHSGASPGTTQVHKQPRFHPRETLHLSPSPGPYPQSPIARIPVTLKWWPPRAQVLPAQFHEKGDEFIKHRPLSPFGPYRIRRTPRILVASDPSQTQMEQLDFYPRANPGMGSKLGERVGAGWKENKGMLATNEAGAVSPTLMGSYILYRLLKISAPGRVVHGQSHLDSPSEGMVLETLTNCVSFSSTSWCFCQYGTDVVIWGEHAARWLTSI